MSDLERLAREIAAHGVRHVFGIPGSGPSYTLIAALDALGVEFVRAHFEGSAALMAGAQARLSGRAGVALSIKGPGLANLLPGLAACQLETIPVVAVSEAYPPDRSWRGAHKGMDHRGLVQSVTKGSRFLSRTGPKFTDLARWAEAEAPGPTHLDIAASAVESEDPLPELPSYHEEHGLEARVADRIAASRRPLLIAGTLSVRRGWGRWLNRMRLPVFTTAAAKGAVDEQLAHAAGVYTGVGLRLAPEHSLMAQADLVIGLGLRSTEVLASDAFACESIHFDPVEDPDQAAPAGSRRVTGTEGEIEVLSAILSEKCWGMESVSAARTALRRRLLDCEFLPATVYDTIEGHFRGRLRVVLDTGYFCTVGEHMCRVEKPEWYLASGQGRDMGVALPMAIGGAIHDSSVPTVAYVGDGGIGMYVSEIKVAAERKLPLLLVMMRDGHFASVRSRALRDRLTSKPVDVGAPSWTRVMEGMGIPAVRVSSRPDLATAMQNWDPHAGPLYVEAEFEPRAYADMVSDLRD